MCVIFLLLSASLLVAAPTEPKNRPWEIKRNYRKFRQTIKIPIKTSINKNIKVNLPLQSGMEHHLP
jgi:hypothetical protein